MGSRATWARSRSSFILPSFILHPSRPFPRAYSKGLARLGFAAMGEVVAQHSVLVRPYVRTRPVCSCRPDCSCPQITSHKSACNERAFEIATGTSSVHVHGSVTRPRRPFTTEQRQTTNNKQQTGPCYVTHFPLRRRPASPAPAVACVAIPPVATIAKTTLVSDETVRVCCS